MARLGHWGAESGHEHAEGLTLGGGGGNTYDTGTKRTGTRSFKITTSAAGSFWQFAFTGATAQGYYACGYFQFPAASGLPGANCNILQIRTGAGSALYGARLTTAGKLQLTWAGTTQVGSDSSATVVADTWYRVEIFAQIGGAGSDDSAELRLDGVTVASETNQTRSTTAPGQLLWGFGTDDPGTSEVIFWDDLALNDSQGSVNNTWVGDHAVACLLSTADSADGNWTDGAGGTASIFEAVNNVPPTGVSTATSGATNQAENASSSVPSSLDVTMQSYTAAGIGASDTINALYTVIEAGSSSTTGSDTMTHELVSNPAVAANGTNSVDIVAGTYPTNWNRGQGTITEQPSVTKGTAPVMRVTKTGAVTRVHTVCFMGIMVSYSPTPAATGRRYFSPIMIG
jgi:hypothetical protein